MCNNLVPDNVFMSQRMQLAALVMQGYVANHGPDMVTDRVIRQAFEIADAMIEQEKNHDRSD